MELVRHIYFGKFTLETVPAKTMPKTSPSVTGSPAYGKKSGDLFGVS